MHWPEAARELEREQRELAARTPEPFRLTAEPMVIGGCFVCFPRGSGGVGAAGDRAWAGAALIATGGVRATALVHGAAGAGYVAGRLALREGTLLEAAVRALPVLPDVLLVNATGRDHPRGAGLALHLGAVLEIPSAGVTNRPLLATAEPPGSSVGATSPLLLDGKEVGTVLRSRAGCRPVFVHAGWRTDAWTATEIVLSACRGARTPEPIRRARQIARLARAGRIR